MNDRTDRDPELELAEACFDIGDMFEMQFEYWSQQADDEPNPRLRVLIKEIAADAMLIANFARADANAILWDYDDGAGI